MSRVIISCFCSECAPNVMEEFVENTPCVTLEKYMLTIPNFCLLKYSEHY